MERRVVVFHCWAVMLDRPFLHPTRLSRLAGPLHDQLKHLLFVRLGNPPLADILTAPKDHNAVADLEHVGEPERDDDLSHRRGSRPSGRS